MSDEPTAPVVQGQTRLLRGDVLYVGGDLYMASLITDMGAIIFDYQTGERSITICPDISLRMVVKRVGEQGYKDWLAGDRSVSKPVANETETVLTINTNPNRMKTKTKSSGAKRPARGGLAAQKAATEAKEKPETEKKPKTDKPPGEGRMKKIMEHSVCAVLRRLGAEGVTAPHATAILAKHGIKDMPAASLNVQVGYGRTGKRPAAPLTKEQVKELIESAPAPEVKEEAEKK